MLMRIRSRSAGSGRALECLVTEDRRRREIAQLRGDPRAIHQRLRPHQGMLATLGVVQDAIEHSRRGGKIPALDRDLRIPQLAQQQILLALELRRRLAKHGVRLARLVQLAEHAMAERDHQHRVEQPILVVRAPCEFDERLVHVARERPARLVLQQLAVRGEDTSRLVAPQPLVLGAAGRCLTLHHLEEVGEAAPDGIPPFHARQALAHPTELELARRDHAALVFDPEVEQLHDGVARRERVPAPRAVLALGEGFEKREMGQRTP